MTKEDKNKPVWGWDIVNWEARFSDNPIFLQVVRFLEENYKIVPDSINNGFIVFDKKRSMTVTPCGEEVQMVFCDETKRGRYGWFSTTIQPKSYYWLIRYIVGHIKKEKINKDFIKASREWMGSK
ncbi:MAG: hypothetical protein LBT91_01030 [Bifidobacteriaceae bacterium]|jgi:hypothetical protein|nr:hypothetical protein [Bifidobacteriaceae bacterium]